MIVISSFRKMGEDQAWDENQKRAIRSWLMFAEHIYIFGQPEPELKNNKVSFVESEDYPRIKDMAAFAGRQHRALTLLTNGDIVIDPAIRKVEMKLRLGNACCASSRRWHFKVKEPLRDSFDKATLTNVHGFDDRGRDVFMAKWHVWTRIAAEMPDKYRIGNPYWDAYITDAFRQHWNDRFLDFTAMRLIFHPMHDTSRLYKFAEEAAP